MTARQRPEAVLHACVAFEIRNLRLYSAPIFICHNLIGGREMRRKFYRRALIVGLVSVGFAGAASIASATHSWGGYHWARTANPFTVKLGSNVSSAWTSSLATASIDWTSSDVLNTT